MTSPRRTRKLPKNTSFETLRKVTESIRIHRPVPDFLKKHTHTKHPFSARPKPRSRCFDEVWPEEVFTALRISLRYVKARLKEAEFERSLELGKQGQMDWVGSERGEPVGDFVGFVIIYGVIIFYYNLLYYTAF